MTQYGGEATAHRRAVSYVACFILIGEVLTIRLGQFRSYFLIGEIRHSSRCLYLFAPIRHVDRMYGLPALFCSAANEQLRRGQGETETSPVLPGSA